MENVHVDEEVNEIKDMENKTVDKIVAKDDEVEDTGCNSVNEDNKDDATDAEVTQEKSMDDTEPVSDENQEENYDESVDEEHKKKSSKISGKKIAIAAGIGVALVGAGILVRKNTMKTAYHIVRSIM